MKEEVVIKEEFFKLYSKFEKYNAIDNDVVSMGNLAVFVDEYHNHDNWKKIEFEIMNHICDKKPYNTHFIIANGIYNIFTSKGLNYVVVDSFNELKRGYLKKNINSHNIIKDIKYFPNWYIEISKYRDISSKEEAFSEICKLFLNNPKMKKSINKYENRLGLAYFIETYFETPKWLELLSNLISSLKEEDLNTASWIIYKNINERYVLDIYKIKHNKELKREVDAEDIDKFINKSKTYYRVYGNMYEKGELRFFDVIDLDLLRHLNIDWFKG